MKTYYVYWTPQQHMIAKVEADTAEDAYKAVVGELFDYKKGHVIYKEVQEESETTYEVFEDSEDHDSVEPRGVFYNY
jgi:hypothetical protein